MFRVTIGLQNRPANPAYLSFDNEVAAHKVVEDIAVAFRTNKDGECMFADEVGNVLYLTRGSMIEFWLLTDIKRDMQAAMEIKLANAWADFQTQKEFEKKTSLAGGAGGGIMRPGNQH